MSQDGQRLFFVAHRAHTRLDDIITQLVDHLQVSPLSVRFLFDGDRLATRDFNNQFLHPDNFQMEDGDVIDVFVEQQGD